MLTSPNCPRLQINLDEIEDLQEDMIDLLYDAEELNEIMGRDFSIGDDINEMDLNAELDNLDAELDGKSSSSNIDEIKQPIRRGGIIVISSLFPS